jgi:aryl-alcohol dehydrogenase-like predicted oxidoreductase
MSSDNAFALLQGVYDAPHSGRFFDTAEIYKTGNPYTDSEADTYNEAMLAPFFATVPRDTITVATKFMPGKWGGKCDYETVKTALMNSLSRLGLAYVDIYYMHRVPSLESGTEFAASCKRLLEEGLLRSVGLSECHGAWLREIHAVQAIGFVQQEWSLLSRSLESDLVPACAELGVTIVAYSPLCRNLLTTTEKPKDWRANLPRYEGEAYDRNLALQAKVGAAADAKGVSKAQLSLAWLFYKAAQLGVTVIPIPGTTKVANAQSNFMASQVEVTEEEGALLEELANQVEGTRYPESMMGSTIDNRQ